MLLDNVTNIPERATRFNQLNSFIQAFLSYPNQAPGMVGHFPDAEHFTGITVKTILDNGYIDIDYVAVAQLLVAGYAVTHYMVDGSAYGLGKSAVVQGCRDRSLCFNNVLVAYAVQFVRGNARLDLRPDHIEHISGQSPCDAHLFLLRSILNANSHVFVFT